MGNPTLTKLLIAGLIVTFVISTAFNNYLLFAGMNNATIQEPYRSAFTNISSQYASFQAVSGQVKDKGLVRNILNFGSNLITGTVNVFVVGLEAMGNFFNIIPVIGAVLTAISLGLPALGGLIALLVLIVGIYVAMRYIQSASNKLELP